jgi:hypothetical protein
VLTIVDGATVIHREPVSLSHNAKFDLDLDDVRSWQESAVAFLDKL